jgi:hypothetical protein
MKEWYLPQTLEQMRDWMISILIPKCFNYAVGDRNLVIVTSGNLANITSCL